MKKMIQLGVSFLLMAVLLPFSGCLKDSVSKHFTIYRPLYKTLEQVKSEVKSTAPVAVTQPGKIYTIGNYIFLNEKSKGVHIIDNTNPAAPVNKAFIPIPGNEDVAVYGNTLYADCFSNLFTIDITNPLQAKLTHTITKLFPDRNYYNGFTIDSAHIIYDWVTKDTSVATDGPEFGTVRNGVFWGCANCGFVLANSLSANKTGQGGSMARFAILNDYLYTVTTSLLNSVSLVQPQQPAVVKTMVIGGGIETIFPFQDKLFIGSTTGMFLYSVANPQQPVILGGVTHFRSCDPVITDGVHAYVTLHSNTRCGGNLNQLDVIDVQSIGQPRLLKTYPLSNPQGLSKDGQWLFVCDGSEGLKCYDATNVTNLSLKSVFPMKETYDVICRNGIAILSAADGLYQLDYRDVNNIRQLSKIGWHK